MKKVLIGIAVLAVAAGAAAFLYRDRIGMMIAFSRLKPAHSFAEAPPPAAPDYSLAAGWAALPNRQDAADALPGGDVTVEEMSEASFPASDPPARWTWEILMDAADADDSVDSGAGARGGAEEVAVRNNPDRERYEVSVGSVVAGYADYHFQPGLITVLHTEIDTAFEGQGLGSELVRRMLDDIRSRDARVLAVCPFVRAFMQRHPEYSDVVWKP